MKKNFSMAAAMMAAAVLSISSFVSCDDEDENKNVFESRTFTVELPVEASSGYCWKWTNATEAAADTISTTLEPLDETVIGGMDKEIWTFKTKENGDEVLKFKQARRFGELEVEKDTVVTFKK